MDDIKSKSRKESIWKEYDNCLKCGDSLKDKRGWKYCSRKCAKLFLKAEYKQRNKEKIRKYNREYQSKAPDTYFIKSEKQRSELLNAMPVCQRCNKDNDLQLCHIKPHWAGGTTSKYNFIVLCRSCHFRFDEYLRDFWKE